MELSYTCLVERDLENIERACELPMPDAGCEIRLRSDDAAQDFVLAGEREREEMRVLQERRQRRARSIEMGSDSLFAAR